MPKIYSSRAMTRAMSVDYPIGDPTGGPAYGEKNDVLTIGLSLAGMAEASAGIGTLMGGLQFAGSALTLVGTLTGNKTLSKIGMVAGLAGFAGSMGAFGETAKNATFANTFGGSPTDVPISSANANLSQSAGASSKPGFMQTPTSTPQADLVANANGPGFSDINKVRSSTIDASKLATDAATKSPEFLESLQKGNYWDATKAAASGVNQAINPAINPYGAMAVGQIASPIADYLSGKTDTEIDKMKAETGYADAKALEMQTALDREKQRRLNLNSGYGQIDTGFTVNPNAMVNPAAAQVQNNGLINNAMQPPQ
jgi:hypothetical protein